MRALGRRIRELLDREGALRVELSGPDEPRAGKDFTLAAALRGGAPPFRVTLADEEGRELDTRRTADRAAEFQIEAPRRPVETRVGVRVTDAGGASASAEHRFTPRPVERRSYVAGQTLTTGILHVDPDRSSWDAAKERLANLLRGYTEKDVAGMLRQFTYDASPDPSVIRNAVLADFQTEAQTFIDLVLTSYQESGERLCADATWNRTTARTETGTVEVTRGRLYVCFSRPQEMRISLFQGTLPFGLRDPDLVRLARGGALNTPVGSVVPGPDTDAAAAPITLFAPVPFDTLAVDIEAGTVRSLGANQNPGPADAQPGEDFFAVSVPAAFLEFHVRAIGPERVISCSQPIPAGAATPADAVQAFGSVGLAGAGSTAIVSTGSPNGPLFGYQTSAGSIGVISYDGLSFAYNRDDDAVLNPNSTLSCP